MLEFLYNVSASGQLVPVTVISLLTVVVLAVVIGTCVVKIRRDATTTQLKQDMLDRGMTADEIKTVLEASPK